MNPLNLLGFTLKIRVVLTGGGTGGHVFPLLAVADELQALQEKNDFRLELYYIGPITGPVSFDPQLFEQKGIRVIPITGSSPANTNNPFEKFVSFLQNVSGFVQCLWHLWAIMPDTVFSKGGFGAVPVLGVSFLYRIPILIHESDAIPGKVNETSKKIASRIAVSFQKSAPYFPYERTAVVGTPTRKVFFEKQDKTNALDAFKFTPDLPVLFIYGGSQGAQALNELILDLLPQLVEKYQIIHQCGTRNYPTVSQESDFMLKNNQYRDRYRLYGFMDEQQAHSAYTSADLIVSRAGSANIFEIAATRTPAILIPFPYAAQDHQRENAYAYASSGAAVVLEEGNVKPNILLDQITSLMQSDAKREAMRQAATEFAKPDAALTVAKELLVMSGAELK